MIDGQAYNHILDVSNMPAISLDGYLPIVPATVCPDAYGFDCLAQEMTPLWQLKHYLNQFNYTFDPIRLGHIIV